MKLSLMTINLTMPIFLDEHFQPGTNPDFREYEAVFQHAQAAGFDAVDLGGGDLMAFGAERVAALLKKYGLTCASVINFGNYTSLREEDILQNENLLRMLIDACVEVETKVLMLPPLRKDGVDGVKAKFSSMNEELKGVMCYTGVRNLDQMDISILRNF